MKEKGICSIPANKLCSGYELSDVSTEFHWYEDDVDDDDGSARGKENRRYDSGITRSDEDRSKEYTEVDDEVHQP